jgi:FkbH-like protein
MEGAETACQNLNYVPGFRREGKDNLGDVRVADIQSNEERLALIQNGLKTYYQNAKPILEVSVQDSEQLERLVDLGKRSNQFNLQLSRLGQLDYQSENSVWVGLSLSDQFSDSGIIGGIVLRKVSNTECAVLELFLSCRVLGRGLETALICQGILEGMRYLQASNVQISWMIGERNEPALNWLASSILDESPVSPGSVTMSDAEIMAFAQPPQGVQVEVKDGN